MSAGEFGSCAETGQRRQIRYVRYVGYVRYVRYVGYEECRLLFMWAIARRLLTSDVPVTVFV
jgi:hypothetical protein